MHMPSWGRGRRAPSTLRTLPAMLYFAIGEFFTLAPGSRFTLIQGDDPINRTSYSLIVVLTILLSACGSQSPNDPAAVMDAYTAAINAHDVEAALQYVADDAVYERPTGQFTGKAEVRSFIEGLIAQNVQVELIGERMVDGEKVTWQSQVTLTDPQNPGGPPLVILNNSESIIRDGKIIFHTATRAQ